MKTYIILEVSKIGITSHHKAFLDENKAMSECHKMADDYMAHLTDKGIKAVKEEQTSLHRLLVSGKDTVLRSYVIKETELDVDHHTYGKVEVMPWDDEVMFHGVKGPLGYYFKTLDPECDTSICYIDSTVFGKTYAVVLNEETELNKMTGYCTMDFIRNQVSPAVPGNDVTLIEDMASYILSKAQGETIAELIKKEQDALNEMAAEAYKAGSRAYLHPYNEDDTSRPITILAYDDCDSILVTDDDGIEQEVTLSEVYRESDRRCPKCGNVLYHEKLACTDTGYPYVCFKCDENFYRFETNYLQDFLKTIESRNIFRIFRDDRGVQTIKVLAYFYDADDSWRHVEFCWLEMPLAEYLAADDDRRADFESEAKQYITDVCEEDAARLFLGYGAKPISDQELNEDTPEGIYY